MEYRKNKSYTETWHMDFQWREQDQAENEKNNMLCFFPTLEQLWAESWLSQLVTVREGQLQGFLIASLEGKSFLL